MPPRFCFVSPWMVNGELVEYLKSHDEVDLLWMVSASIIYVDFI
jgi:hypothetical protein